jgi:RHS repeat-associated protein
VAFILWNHFTGKERDAESGNDYFGARYYGSSMGRFMSPDPSGLLAQHPEDPQSWNLYVYARNNPLINIDPNGLDCIYATDNGKGVESIDHDSNSGECGQNGGTWLSGYVDEDWAHYNKTAGAFEAAAEDGGQVNFAQFQSGAQTNDSGDCLSGCGSYGFASTSADFLTGQLVGNSRPTDGSDPLDGLLTFMTERDQAVTDFWKGVAGPINGKDNWAGPGGMGPPQGTGDWRAAVHDYNFNTNGITIGSYFNPHLSPATSRALIQSNNNLMRTGGVQGAKEKMVFGVINAFQWYADSWK